LQRYFHVLEAKLHRPLNDEVFEYGVTHEHILPFISLIATLLLVSISTTSSQSDISLSGRVVNAETGSPIEGVRIYITGFAVNFYGSFNESLMTNKNGYYDAILPRGYFRITVMVDNPETLGLDYVPAQMELNTWDLVPEQRALSVDFELYPGASIIIRGSPEFVELGKTPEGMAYAFTALDPHFRDIERTGAIRSYDELTRLDLGLRPGEIIVPADTPVSVGAPDWFTDDNGSNFYTCPQGSRITVDINRAVMARNIAVVRDRLSSAQLQAGELGMNGIDVTSEANDLNTALGLLDSARLELRDGNYAECFLDLRSSYLMIEGVLSSMANAQADAAFSPIPLTFLLALSGFALAGIMVEGDAARMAAGALASSIMIGFYLYVSPGWRLTDPLLLLAACAMAALTAIGLAIMIPRIRGDIVTPSGIAFLSSLTSTFSLATRNLKRRRLRSSLVLISILTLVFGFTAFTTFQARTLVMVRRMLPPYPNPEPPEGLMVAAPLGSDYVLSASMVEALRADPLVSSVAPKTETIPMDINSPLAQLISKGYNITVFGAIGLSSDEVRMNHLDAAVINGTYGLEGDNTSLQAILISAIAARQLHVTIGDKVEFTIYSNFLTVNYTVIGILDDRIFEGIIDLDGQSIRPYVQQQEEVYHMSPDKMVVFNWKELLRLGIGSARITRINVQTRSGADIMSLSYKLTKKWHCPVYASVNNSVQIFLYSLEYSLSGGMVVPMLMALVGLNVLACTLNGIYERRKEIATLSLVGLNPSQISYIFLAESGLVAFVGGAIGYLLGLGGPRLLLSLGGPGFLTEKVSWMWSVAVILMAVVVSVSASVIPAMKASTIATPKLPLKWKLEHLPAKGDAWQLHMPQLVSQLEIERFIGFFKGKVEEMQLLQQASERMELNGIAYEYDERGDVKKLLFTYSWALEGSRAFQTEDELVVLRRRGYSTYEMNLVIRIVMVYNYEPMDAAKRTASVIRKLILQWTTTPSAERWGSTEELIMVEGLCVNSGSKAVLSGIDLIVKKGEILGVTGEGGLVLLLAIAGLCRPSKGTVYFLGADTYARRSEVKRVMGILLKGAGLYGGFTVRDNLRFLAKLGGMRDAVKAIEVILERGSMMRHADEMTSNLSREYERKLMIAQTLINNPSLLLLEEPLVGLEGPEAKRIEGLLRDLNRTEGMTMICFGRKVDELGFCDRIVRLRGGTIEMVDDGKAE
jgi:ABC-type multidrug transport system ATPase subunit/ABC-type lipoprotein release transport system permease subunit